MTTTCPKCRHVRPPGAQAPDWQCPACGVAYAKAAAAAEAQRHPEVTRRVAFEPRPERRVAWGRWFGIAAVGYGAWLGLQRGVFSGGASGGLGSLGASFGGGVSDDDLRRVAAATRSGDVVIYTTTHCPYCAQAKQWMTRYGFAFTECNAETSSSCAAELLRHQSITGGQGVPYLVVRGHHMKDGFDSDEFVAALKG